MGAVVGDHASSGEMRRSSLALAALAAAYLATRLYRLLAIPVFVDEALHMTAAGQVLSDLSTGQRLGKWFSILAYGIWMQVAGDSLLAARLLAVLLGLTTMLVLFFEGRAFGEKSISRGTFSALIYILAPLSLFYDRQVLTDEFLALLLALIVFASFRFAAGGRWRDAVTVCMLVAVAPLFKGNGALFLPVPLLIVLTAAADQLRPRLKRFAVPYAATLAVVMLIAKWISNVVPDVASAAFQGPVLGTVWARAGANGVELTEILWVMLTPISCVALLLGIVFVLISGDGRAKRRAAALSLVLAYLLLSYLVFYDALFSRYVLPAVVPVCMLGAEALLLGWRQAHERLGGRAWVAATSAAVLLLASPALSSVRLLIAPGDAQLTKNDVSQYFTGWTSGYGLENAVADLRQLSLENADGIVLLRPPTLDQPLFGTHVYRKSLGPGVQVINLVNWESPEVAAEVASALRSGIPVYLLFDSAYPFARDEAAVTTVAQAFAIEEVRHYAKPGDNPGLVIWRITTKAQTGPRDGG